MPNTPNACLNRVCLNSLNCPWHNEAKTTPVDNLKAEEAKRITAAIPKGARIIVLDEHGQQVTTKALANKLEDWLGGGQDVALIVGGPDGLEQSLIDSAQWKWGLSHSPCHTRWCVFW